MSMSKQGVHARRHLRLQSMSDRLRRAWTQLVLTDIANVRKRQGTTPRPDVSDDPAERSHWALTSELREEVRLAIADGDHQFLRERLLMAAAAYVAWLEDLDAREQAQFLDPTSSAGELDDRPNVSVTPGVRRDSLTDWERRNGVAELRPVEEADTNAG